MKFFINKNKFIDGLNAVSRVLAPTPVFEILKGIKLELYNDTITLKASDSLVSMEYVINNYEDDVEIFSSKEEGEILLPARHFIEIVKKLPTNYIEITSHNNIINIKSGKSEFNIQGYDVSEYPEFPLVDKSNKISFNTKVFNSIIKETLFCTAVNDQRPVLEGVNFTLENKLLTATSTDSHRLSKRKLKLDNIDIDKNFNIIIPRKALQSIQKIIENKEGDFTIYYEENRILFTFENIVYSAILINGKYPNTEKLIPSLYECEVIVESNILYDAVDRISLVSKDEKNDIVKLIMENDTINISSNSKELGNAEEEILGSVKTEEGKFEISVSAKFLKEAINAVNSENIIIKFSGELTAFTIQPSDYHRDIVEVLLPVRTY